MFLGKAFQALFVNEANLLLEYFEQKTSADLNNSTFSCSVGEELFEADEEFDQIFGDMGIRERFAAFQVKFSNRMMLMSISVL